MRRYIETAERKTWVKTSYIKARLALERTLHAHTAMPIDHVTPPPRRMPWPAAGKLDRTRAGAAAGQHMVSRDLEEVLDVTERLLLQVQKYQSRARVYQMIIVLLRILVFYPYIENQTLLPQHLKLQIWESLSTRLYDLYDLSQN